MSPIAIAVLGVAIGSSSLRASALRLLETESNSILFAGDSTMRYQFESFCLPKSSIDKNHGYWVCQPWNSSDGAFYIDYQKSRHEDVRAGPDGAVRQLLHLTGVLPRVVYFNFYGLWTLHLEPVLPWRNWAEKRRNYTAQNLVKSMQRTLSLGVKALVLMTTHHVCEARYVLQWRALLDAPEDAGAAAGCRRYVALGCQGLAGPCGDAAEELCLASLLTSAGADLVAAEELSAFELLSSDPDVRLGLVPANEITARAGCPHTADGRHYDTLTVDEEVEAFREALANVTA